MSVRPLVRNAWQKLLSVTLLLGGQRQDGDRLMLCKQTSLDMSHDSIGEGLLVGRSSYTDLRRLDQSRISIKLNRVPSSIRGCKCILEMIVVVSSAANPGWSLQARNGCRTS